MYLNISNHILTLISLIKLMKTSSVKQNDKIHLESKFGIDGSGSHQIKPYIDSTNLFEEQTKAFINNI